MFNSKWILQRMVNPMSKLPQKIIIMDFFLLVELETKLIIFYHHTMKYHNTQDEKIK
jgi:hypothetical protein